MRTTIHRTVALFTLMGAIAAAGSLVQAATAIPKATLTGAQEVPAVESAATGTAAIEVAADHSVTGSIETHGIEGTMAHIHQGAKGLTGPAIVTLQPDGPNRWRVPPGTRLTDPQYSAWKSGDLYVNVHSAAHKAGEIRAQLMP